MEKTCEFCGAPGPVVYCQADAALLCLSCDAKVHSANALFGRHSRSLLCDSCKENPASVRCLDHLMLSCQECDLFLHKCFAHHKKLMIGSFTGCPSVKQFAELWGFDVNDLHQLSTVESATSTASLDTERGSCSQQQKKLSNHQREQNNGLILHQLLELKNLQLTEGDNQKKSLRHNGVYVTSSLMRSNSGTLLNEGLKQQSKEFNKITNELQSLDKSNQVLNGEHFPSPISQLDISSSVADPFWQHNKSPVDNDQFWSQNLQDLGMCQELGSIDDFNMPDVDITFRNFEDLLTGDPDLTRALVEDDPMSSDTEKASMNKLEKSLLETTQEMAASHINFKKEANSSDHVTRGISRSVGSSPHPLRYSRSATFTCSRLSAESCRSDFLNSGTSGCFRRSESSNNVEELNGVEMEGLESSIRISKDKKKTRMHCKKTQLAPRKARTDLHKKNKSRYPKLQGYNSDTATVTKSC
ncbi:putative zinc finger protein At1g68190 [Chenopodium quinoa]|uniref:B box-type domain-containing protein n=1 Tax=Chenopodium quinoa TaxID=63459 RepID=A0A803KUT5_CHEQI|nr:putative zinc finger protein At1g68190 [Chenopodium quinoa]XP_021750777.1 putative zinc finger protein At1g68190 [Chenopodium quinoa]XP_021750844.1 putative zinc finger protein At1g68190 [Chenopodium quinoa]XP_021750893.1 putative zinc finger protein At1g68190 [Chenopodium quinoa]